MKETDRAAAVIEGLALMGIDAWMDGSDLFIEGDPMLSTPAGLRFDAKGDHRLAMTWAVAGLCGANPIEIQGFDAVSVSYPGFLDDIRMLAR